MNAKVHRDAQGVPHLRAGDPLALAYLQGLNVAADRAWQIELERRRYLGTTAAFLGPEGVAWDAFARQARLADTAERCLQSLDDGTREWIEAYVAGVNHGLPGGAARAPEFAATGLTLQEWEPWAPLGIWMAVHILFAGFPTKLWREQVARKLGDAAIDVFTSEGPRTAGSNGWLIPGEHTATGAALIAGDPHRYIESPGVYQQIRLACPEYDVIGLAVPGIPGIAHFGHAGDVAWAITNAMADYQDLYREQLRRTADGVEALGPDGWEPATAHTESVAIAGRDAVQVEVIETARGPVIAGGPDDDHAVSLRYPPRVSGQIGFDALPKLLQATTVGDVDEAVGHWVEPVNVVLAADTVGGLLHRTAGLVPRRHPANRLRVVPAWDSAHAWRGWEDDLPRAAVDGIAVMANARELAEPLGVEFAAPHRSRRIRELLTARDGWTADDMPTIHTDTWLGSAGQLLDRLATLADLSPEAVDLRDSLQRWDRRMDATSTTASSYAAIRKALCRRIADHPVLAPLDDDSGCPDLFLPWLDPLTHISFALENLLATDLLPSIDFDDLLRGALEDVAAKAPRGPWGETHQLSPLHMLRGPLFAPGEEPIDLALSGDHHCVMSTSSLPGITDVCIRSSAARFAWDLADRSNSRWIVPLGASGVLGDPHHHDQLPLWLRGELAPIVTDWDQLTPDVTEFEQESPLGRIRIVPVVPERDLDLIVGWVHAERARFWGMTELSRDEVLGIYTFLDAAPTHHVYLIHLDDVPVALFQTYDPQADPVGEVYPVQPGDIGTHILIAPGDPRPGFTGRLFDVLFGFLLGHLGHPRVVVEPDARNAKAVARLERTGFELGPEVEIRQHDETSKRARLALLTAAGYRASQLG
ncbi:peptidase S45 penicillin amidase [Kribbella flavida DSM 17836]|uniref:Lysine N-acyltransferase MbtK n=1 Tax=Kribbella flavida (strain DSM 17836 / JCM 10339 / NBRC 14399) TaxID=479435 RepID=D2PYP2_KRIFD|nr:GNAT family N-acetyltransferase [Kribbella flavida]ADB29888.1 peptidase S45 penicillin amidase [Kribbella flavida DSM 17836]